MATRTDRLEMRLSPQQKGLLERAAVLSGQPLTGFALSHLLDRAREVVEKHERTVLSGRDFARFLKLIDATSEPAPALKAAVRRHRKFHG